MLWSDPVDSLHLIALIKAKIIFLNKKNYYIGYIYEGKYRIHDKVLTARKVNYENKYYMNISIRQTRMEFEVRDTIDKHQSIFIFYIFISMQR